MVETNSDTDFGEKCALAAKAVGAKYCIWCEPQANEDGTEDAVAHVMADGVEVITFSESLGERYGYY